MPDDADFEPWTPHDGTHVPAPDGTEVMALWQDGEIERLIVGERSPPGDPWAYCAWLWAVRPNPFLRVVAYRLRRNPGLEQLRRIAEDVPAREVADA